MQSAEREEEENYEGRSRRDDRDRDLPLPDGLLCYRRRLGCHAHERLKLADVFKAEISYRLRRVQNARLLRAAEQVIQPVIEALARLEEENPARASATLHQHHPGHF